MNLDTLIRTIETHTGGMPTRIVVEGTPSLPGNSMSEHMVAAYEVLDPMRRFLTNEPRGHAGMFGAFLTPACREDTDIGVIFFSASGFLGMCGHGTIGVATALVEKKMVPVTEPVTEIRLDTPEGLVVASAAVENGKAHNVTFTNVPSFPVVKNAQVTLPDIGQVTINIAFGGNHYAILDLNQTDMKFDIANAEELIDLGLKVIRSTREQMKIIDPVTKKEVEFKAAILALPETDDAPAKNMMVKEPGYFDKSPCGTGTSARMAVAFEAGELGLNEPFYHRSLLGSEFEGRVIATKDVNGIQTIIPQITGSAWITGSAEFTLDETDPFPQGFYIGK